MLAKVMLVILDGLGDRPIPELNNLTPLESADTPNLDQLASKGICGLLSTLGKGRVPGSDIAHLTLFGYDYNEVYSGRGPIEAAGIGLVLQPGDVAFRANLGTVNEEGIVIDRRAGRIDDVSELVKDLDGIEIEGVQFIVKPGTGHRAAFVMRGAGLSSDISDPDSHFEGGKLHEPTPLYDSPEAKFTTRILSEFLSKAHLILSQNPVNKERVAQGLLPANYLLLRGAGQQTNMPLFHEKYGLRAAAIAGAGLYKGVAAYSGMKIIDVLGATGLTNTDVKAKFTKGVELLKDYDFVFIHVKATDNLSHDGDFSGKRDFIERIDEACSVFFNLPNDVLLIITGDHTTSCASRNHTGDPVPLLMYAANDIRTDAVVSFGERPCSQGGIGILLGVDMMPEIMNLLNRAKLIGA